MPGKKLLVFLIYMERKKEKKQDEEKNKIREE